LYGLVRGEAACEEGVNDGLYFLLIDGAGILKHEELEGPVSSVSVLDAWGDDKLEHYLVYFLL